MANLHPQVELIRTVSVAFAVVAILRFTSLNKYYIARHKPMMKLVAFKLIVFLETVQSVSDHVRKARLAQ